MISCRNFRHGKIWVDTLQTFFGHFGLTEVLSALHGPNLPATHNHGSLPIDGLFAPVSLIPLCWVGYLPFGEGMPSDH